MLLLVGTLDEKTPAYVLSDAIAHFSGPFQQLVTIPNATHVTLEHSAVTASTGGVTCGLRLVSQFLQQARGQLDAQCTLEIGPLDFRGDAASAQRLFGRADLYED
jgi:hypothetical protein